MSKQEHILDIYGSIATVTGKMVDAARRSDWDRLVALEHDCRDLIETLKQSDAGANAGAQFVQRKVAFIRKVLADDAEVRKFTEPWMTKLEAYLGNARQEHKLRRAYEPDLGSAS
jgi:flagellar protein FliT